ncbi:MAG: GWxTD domain-containing protein, partial [bacterium]|nr:GWxTD domain-containing protein [bacterium]
MNKKSKCLFVIVSFIVASFLFSHSELYAKKKDMSASHAEFLSDVRYIITKDEKKFFKGLPADKRDSFIERFWSIRDTNSFTENNEFKEEYFDRIDTANKRYSSGIAGWLTDRGKCYVLLGPPEHMSNYPLGNTSQREFARPYEVWFYPDGVVLYFVDKLDDGDYRVDYVSMEHHMAVQ